MDKAVGSHSLVPRMGLLSSFQDYQRLTTALGALCRTSTVRLVSVLRMNDVLGSADACWGLLQATALREPSTPSSRTWWKAGRSSVHLGETGDHALPALWQ